MIKTIVIDADVIGASVAYRPAPPSQPIFGLRVFQLTRRRTPTRCAVVPGDRAQSLHPEIGAPHAIVSGQGLMRAFENHPPGFEHIPVVTRL